ncbi:MAG: hypothetical protein MT490_16250 [Sphingomonas sp.]|uniref:hypothetical protein n=1 Tax=Sphingomonas sp. TaxID=28214 RepID=UPI002273C879|nr:hypothetical protein [Sphingomonas sp.]MCX8477340.1 hypothetical protein [Sphingomonas sp.]
MKMHPIRPRAALFIGAALLSTPAFAQETPAPQTVTPPPILVTPTLAPQPAPRVIEMAPASPIVQPAPPPGPAPETAPAPRAETRAAARPAPARQVTRTTTTTRQTTPARATAPAAPPAAAVEQPPAPAAQAPAVPVPTAVTPAPETAAPVADTTATQTETVRSTGLAWPWLLGGLLLVLAGGLALLMMRRRRSESDYVEEAMYEAPIAPRTATEPVDAAPLAAAPVVEPRRKPVVSPEMAAAAAAAAAAPAAILPAAEPEPAEAHVEAELTEAESEDLAGITDAPAPVANRPWLELGLRPVRAGTSEEEALVDVELTVGNSGDVPARDVQISAFMLTEAEASEMESLLTGHAPDAAVPPVTIAPGDGTRVDAHLAVPKGEMGRTFNPVVVAEARYTLPDGSEGRTSAAFKIGRPSAVSEGVGPIGASRPHMVDDVEAELIGAPEHA